MTEVEGRGQQAGGNKRQCCADTDNAEPWIGRQPAGCGEDTEQRQQPVTGARRGGEEYDGI